MKKDLATRLLLRVKELRIELDLTQAEFARKAGFTYKYYQALEAGRKNDFRMSTLEKLAKGCRVPAWQLVKFDREPRPTNARVRHG